MFNMFPYVNLHKINLDWIITTVNNAVSTIQHSVRQIEAALDTVNGLTGRVEALETATQQLSTSVSTLSTSVETLDTRVNGAYRRIGALETSVQDLDERVNGAYRRITTVADDVAGKAQLPIIINLSADAFPAQIPSDTQTRVQAALAALQSGTGAAQVHIEQQADQTLPATFNLWLSYAGDGALTGIMSQTIYDGNAQEYLSRITTVSINSSAMTWEMGSQTVNPGMEYMLRYNLQALTPEAQRQARTNISAAYTEDVAPKAIQLTATLDTETRGHWTGATWAALMAHARNGGVITASMGNTFLAFTASINKDDDDYYYIESPVISSGICFRLLDSGTFSIKHPE